MSAFQPVQLLVRKTMTTSKYQVWPYLPQGDIKNGYDVAEILPFASEEFNLVDGATPSEVLITLRGAGIIIALQQFVCVEDDLGLYIFEDRNGKPMFEVRAV